MSYSVWQATVRVSGAPVAGAAVEVRNESDGLYATIYDGPAGSPISQPGFVSDSEGVVRFYAEDGIYKITATKDADTVTWRHVQVGEAQGKDVGTAADELLTRADADTLYTPYTLNNTSATTDPAVGDDSDDGYSIGSVWINTTTDESFKCFDATVGAAVWKNTSLELTDLGSAAIVDIGSGPSQIRPNSDNEAFFATAADLANYIDKTSAEDVSGKKNFTSGLQAGTSEFGTTQTFPAYGPQATMYYRAVDWNGTQDIQFARATIGSGTSGVQDLDSAIFDATIMSVGDVLYRYHDLRDPINGGSVGTTEIFNKSVDGLSATGSLDANNGSVSAAVIAQALDDDTTLAKITANKLVATDLKMTELASVDDVQYDATLDPGVSPTEGDSYILLDTSALHANFGTITGVADNDIVIYINSSFVVLYSPLATKAAEAFVNSLNELHLWDGSSWNREKSIGINAQTGTSYTVQASDNGKVITLNNASPITLTINTGLGAGFNFVVIQKGSGQVTFAGTATLNNGLSHTKTGRQHAMVSFVADVADNFTFQGDTA